MLRYYCGRVSIFVPQHQPTVGPFKVMFTLLNFNWSAFLPKKRRVRRKGTREGKEGRREISFNFYIFNCHIVRLTLIGLFSILCPVKSNYENESFGDVGSQ